MKAAVLGCSWLLLLTCCLAAAAQDAPDAAETPETPRTAAVASRPAETAGPAIPAAVFQRQPAFYIPFSVSQNSPTPVDVILFASADFGANWDPYARRPATEKYFLFRAARDGEYWFASRKVAAGTQLPADGALAPELRVIIDTAGPQLSLDARLDSSSGEILAAWRADDESLVAETVSLQYQTGPGQPWKQVAIERPTGGAPLRTLQGETRWKPERGATLVSVKLAARDRADNVNELTRRLFAPLSLVLPFGQTPPADESPVPADPLSAHGLPPGAVGPPAAVAAAAAPQPPAAPNATPDPFATDSSPQPLTGSGEPQAEAGSAGSPPAPQPTGTSGSTAWPSDVSTTDPDTPANFAPAASPVGPPRAQEVATTIPGESPAPELEPEPAASNPAADAATDPRGGPSELPSGERPRMTRSQRFNLDYSIDAAGPAGVEKVELWATRNGGRDWDLWMLDEDRESPLTVEVEADGVYGFRVVIVGSNGLSSQTPRSGAPADLWVGVDTTSPVAEITSAAYGADDHAGQLDIRWTAVDANLSARPVSLSFGNQPDGPWTTIASGLPNSGQYYWRVDASVPEKFYLRAEVRDEAGNSTVAHLHEPIHSAGLTPRGRIRGVTTIDE